MMAVSENPDFNQTELGDENASGIALITPEFYPLAQTGGLANMVAGLAEALHRLGKRPLVFLPNYQCISIKNEILPEHWQVPLENKSYRAHFCFGRLPSGIPVYLLDIPEFFNRRGLYGESGTDYPDNASRFVAFAKGVLAGIRALDLRAKVLHVHDWQAALVPFLLRTQYADDDFFAKTASLLTLHNMSYQGIFPAHSFPLLGIDPKYFHMDFLEFYGKLNFLKGGLISSDLLTTVSPSYAGEILQAPWGCGLEGVLKNREKDLYGILNGIDEDLWNPATDTFLPFPYEKDHLELKVRNKEALQAELGLRIDPSRPLFTMVTRLVEQKGIDLLWPLLSQLNKRKLQLAILGSGSPDWERDLLAWSQKIPQAFSLSLAYDTALSHRMTAGADFMLVPSRFEPCGYNQMFAQRYGTVPIVSSTGGLKDTVVEDPLDHAKNTGFLFTGQDGDGLLQAVERALDVYRRPQDFQRLQINGMIRDFSWNRSAHSYVELYQKALRRRRDPD